MNPPDTFKRAEFEKWEKLHLRIEALTFQTFDFEEIKRKLQESPDFDIDDLNLDAEIYFMLAIRHLDDYAPREEHFEMDHPEGRQEYIEHVEAHQISQETLQSTLATLGESIDSTYFQTFPKGDTFEKLRSVRSSRIKRVLRKMDSA